jgi:hypothetical protein
MLLLRLAIVVTTMTLVPASGVAFAQVHEPEPGYVDDRSSPEAVIRSLYDAVSRREYARAYGYWEQGSPDLPPFEEFEQGYANTVSVDVTIGDVVGGVGAGQLYFSVPVRLVATISDGSAQTFVGCYILHLARPQLQATPPFQPMAIQRANVQQVTADADTDTLCERPVRPSDVAPIRKAHRRHHLPAVQ